MKSVFKIIKSTVILIIFLFQIPSFSQETNNCNLRKSKNNEINAIDAKDFECLAKNTEKDKLVVYTFGIWCSPCIAHLDNAISIKENYNVEFYVLLVDNESEKDY